MALTDRASRVCPLFYSLVFTDWIHQFRAVLPGGTFPGPVIRGNKGDRFRLNVINHLTDATMLQSTTIVRPNKYHFDIRAYFEQHWHGIFQQKQSSWADGTAFITQCPIAANDSFLYDFKTADQAGTFWYHSHLCESWWSESPFCAHIPLATQYCDGLRGAFILYDPHDPHKLLYDVDNGMSVRNRVIRTVLNLLHPESTIITLADW